MFGQLPLIYERCNQTNEGGIRNHEHHLSSWAYKIVNHKLATLTNNNGYAISESNQFALNNYLKIV